MNKKDKLALSGNMKVAGRGLLSLAKEQMRSNLRERCVGEVQFCMDAVLKMDASIEHCRNVKAFYSRRLAAIEAGDFVVKMLPTLQGEQVVYNEKELNERR